MDALSTGSLVPSQAAALELAVKVGLSRSAAERAHLDDTVQAVLEANERRRNQLGINSIPEFVVNGRPLAPAGMYAATATVDNLDVQYQVALDDARRAVGQGIPAHALALWGERRERCGDDELAEEEPLAGEDEDDEKERTKDEPPSFAWRLAALLLRGTGCAVASHSPATVDEYNPDAPPRRDGAPLLALPLPHVGLPTFGPSDAPVPIFVVCNLRGRYCHDQIDRARRLSKLFPGQVRAVWVPWVDLSLDGAEQDLVLAEAALCAAAEGGGWEFLNTAGTAGVTGRSRVDVSVIATNAGLDGDSLVACVGGESKRARAAVLAARAAGIGYGPTVVIGGRAYLGGFNDDAPARERVMTELAPGLLEALVPSW
jgi:predicted DsbA family dithiol-disulfide isomerase